MPKLKQPKIQLKPFNGSKPLDWLFQADQYFTLYHVLVEQRLHYVSFFMQGDALSWFKWLHNNQLLTTWDAFTRALALRFGPSSFENHKAALFKLWQTGTVTEYQVEFERLNNCVTGLSADTILQCFISGLKLEIQQEMAMHHPYCISQAIKLIEDKLNMSRARPFTRPQTPYVPRPNPSPNSPLLPTPPTNSNTLPIRCLSNMELQQRRAKGLCFNCEEKFAPDTNVRNHNF